MKFILSLFLALVSLCVFGQGNSYTGNFTGNGGTGPRVGQTGLTNIPLSGLNQSGAAIGQVPIWTNGQWNPGDVSGSAISNSVKSIIGNMPLSNIWQGPVNQANVNLLSSQLVTNPDQSLSISNQPLNVDLSYNTGGLAHLVSCLSSNGNPVFDFDGDSTGLYVFGGLFNWLNSNTVAGVQIGAPLMGFGEGFFDFTSSAQYYLEPAWWGNGIANNAYYISAGTNGFYSCHGYNSGKPPTNAVLANLFQFWYFAGPGYGTATLSLSSNRTTWTPYVIDETLPATGLQVTNISLPLQPWSCGISNVTGQFKMLWPGVGLINTNPGSGALMYAFSQGGATMGQLLGMGSNNMACWLTNSNPTVIINQQTKPVGSLSVFPQYFGFVTNTALCSCDNIIIPSEISSNQPPSIIDPPLTSVMAYTMRQYAVQNGATLVDCYTPMNNWNLLNSLGYTIGSPHLSGAGIQYAWSIFSHEINLEAYWNAAGLWQPSWAGTNGGGVTGNYIPNLNGWGTNLSVKGGFHWESTPYGNSGLDLGLIGTYYSTLWMGYGPGSPTNSTNFLLNAYVNTVGGRAIGQMVLNGADMLNFKVGGIEGAEFYGNGSSLPGLELGTQVGNPGVNNVVFRNNHVGFSGEVGITNGYNNLLVVDQIQLGTNPPTSNWPSSGVVGSYIPTLNGIGTNLSVSGGLHWGSAAYPASTADYGLIGTYYPTLWMLNGATTNSTNFVLSSSVGTTKLTTLNGGDVTTVASGSVAGITLYNAGAANTSLEFGNAVAQPASGTATFRQSDVDFAGSIHVTNGIYGNGSGLTNLPLPSYVVTNGNVGGVQLLPASSFGLAIEGDAGGDALFTGTEGDGAGTHQMSIDAGVNVRLVGGAYYGSGSGLTGIPLTGLSVTGADGLFPIVSNNAVVLGANGGVLTNLNAAQLTGTVPQQAMPVCSNLIEFPWPPGTANPTASALGWSNTELVDLISVPSPTFVSHVLYFVNSAGNAGYHIGISIYNTNGAKIMDTGPFAQPSSAGAYSQAVTNGAGQGYVLPAGWYPVGVNVDYVNSYQFETVSVPANVLKMLNCGPFGNFVGTNVGYTSGGQNFTSLTTISNGGSTLSFPVLIFQ
jgi:hypothetical protein